MININQFMAGKNKAVIAQFLGDKNMLSEALYQVSKSMNVQPGNFLLGSVDFAYKMILDNVLINFKSYGDLTVFDGDSSLAQSQINLEVDDSKLIPLPRWSLN